MARLSGVRKALAYHLSEPVVSLLARTSITPNTVTWLGFLLILGAAALIVTEHLFAAGFFVLAAGFLDMLDGALARHTNRTTLFGAILDSALDRLSDAVLLLSILALFLLAEEQSGLFSLLIKEWSILVTAIALFASLLVSYIRARSEGLGIECQAGLFTRPERIIILVVGLLLNQVVIALCIIVVFSLITAVQRLLYVRQQTKNLNSL
jgi:CDP-diacylglycerol--glycerol-3-phosphate 3-phosphatidyltransferase